MRRCRGALIALVLCGLLLAAAGVVWAGEGYTLEWWSLDGGGGTSAGGIYELSGSIGQADAGELSGGAYVVTGGFRVSFVEWPRLYLPLKHR